MSLEWVQQVRKGSRWCKATRFFLVIWDLYNWGHLFLRNLGMIPLRSHSWWGNLVTRTYHHPSLWVISGQPGLSLTPLILWSRPHCWEYLSKLPLQPRPAQMCRQHHGLGGEKTWGQALALPCTVYGRQHSKMTSVSHTLFNLPAGCLSMGGTCECDWIGLLQLSH